MSDLKICRICLRTGGKMYKYDKYQLKNYYEQVMSMKLSEKDSLPKRFCYECATLLHKFHKFKEKCFTGQKMLNEILWKGAITYESLKTIDRQSHSLTSLDVITISKRVKTHIYKHKQKPRVKIQQIELPPIENVEIDLQSECSFRDDYDDKETIETKVANIENVFTDDVKVPDDKLSSDDETLLINLGKKDDDKKVIETKIDYDGMSSDDEKALIDLRKENVDKKSNNNILLNKKKVKKKEKKKKNRESEENTNKFRLESRKGKFLDSNNWLKIYLNEEEAEREFKARGEDRKYLKAPYKCTDCFKGFSQQDMLDRHIKLRHVETLGPIECRFCRMRFKWKCYLTRHMPRHYTIYKCLRCNLVCRMETSAVFHEDYHNGVIRKCKHCGEEFKHLSTYYTHLRTHRSAHVCRACGVSFVSAAGLHLHRLVKHVGAAEQTQDGAKTDAPSDTYCERCNIKFETRHAYEEHLFHSAMHSKGVEDLAEDTPAPACPKVRKKGMRTPRKPTTCSYCGKIFPTQSACMKHHHAEHPRTPFFPNEERHICEICGMSLAAVSVAHHLNTHTRERLFTCNTCGVQFNSKSSMNRHQLTHTGEKPFACSLCDKRFTQSNSVKLHYRTFHLKQPYPKRNRRKKTDEVTLAEDFRTEGESESLTLDRWR
ncbi:zinc finger protein 879 isoform X1 [Manduca sexta]|uniref:zinc finger protein 879 isoform X1 n=1 Tax=Manduca sexta TaxID=7130 RepID=UPI00188FCF4D|nr:zinc finger protein 879 isoform X1 [Manduca sexta]